VQLRAHPGEFGLVTANGGFVSEHSAAVYSTAPYSSTHRRCGQTGWVRRERAEYQVGEAL
jgi:acetyl-CoA C-acetyltransferase